ncbi:unnamed protein product, partial [Meganyctiphanes norvegica]
GPVELWTYFYSFVLLLVVSNTFFFCHVLYIVIKTQRASAAVLKNKTKKQERERLWLYVKLFLMMGITWVAEIIPWLNESCYGSFFTDAINSLQGLFLFIIFICKADMLKKIRKQWSPYIRTIKEAVGLSVSESEQSTDSKSSQKTTSGSSGNRNYTTQISHTGSTTGAQVNIPLSEIEQPTSQDTEAASVSDKHKTSVSDIPLSEIEQPISQDTEAASVSDKHKTSVSDNKDNT